MRLAEIYKSIQGEGRLSGTESTFVRASGCNLRCWFCDTPFASWQPIGEDFSVEEIIGEVTLLGPEHVVLTGGEPMLFAELIPLCRQLKARQHHITIETAGTLYLPLECDLMSISPKLRNSTPDPKQHPRWAKRHEETRDRTQVIRRLINEHDYQLKFVIDQETDCREVEEYLVNLPNVDRNRVLLMPQGTTGADLDKTSQWLKPYCDENGLRFCPRKQIEWFGLARGT